MHRIVSKDHYNKCLACNSETRVLCQGTRCGVGGGQNSTGDRVISDYFGGPVSFIIATMLLRHSFVRRLDSGLNGNRVPQRHSHTPLGGCKKIGWNKASRFTEYRSVCTAARYNYHWLHTTCIVTTLEKVTQRGLQRTLRYAQRPEIPEM